MDQPVLQFCGCFALFFRTSHRTENVQVLNTTIIPVQLTQGQTSHRSCEINLHESFLQNICDERLTNHSLWQSNLIRQILCALNDEVNKMLETESCTNTGRNKLCKQLWQIGIFLQFVQNCLLFTAVCSGNKQGFESGKTLKIKDVI